MGFIWTIIIGFLAGIIAPSSPHTLARPSDGIAQMKARD